MEQSLITGLSLFSVWNVSTTCKQGQQKAKADQQSLKKGEKPIFSDTPNPKPLSACFLKKNTLTCVGNHLRLLSDVSSGYSISGGKPIVSLIRSTDFSDGVYFPSCLFFVWYAFI